MARVKELVRDGWVQGIEVPIHNTSLWSHIQPFVDHAESVMRVCDLQLRTCVMDKEVLTSDSIILSTAIKKWDRLGPRVPALVDNFEPVKHEKHIDFLFLENPVGLQGSDVYSIYMKMADGSYKGLRGKSTKDMFQRNLTTGYLQITPNLMQNIKLVYGRLENEVLCPEPKVKQLGLRYFSLETLKKLLPVVRVKPSVMQVEINAYKMEWSLRSFCRDHNIAVVALHPFGSPNAVATPDTPLLEHHPTVVSVAQAYDRTPCCVLLWYLLQNMIAVVYDISEYKQSLKRLILRPEHMAALSSLDCDGRHSITPGTVDAYKLQDPLWPFIVPVRKKKQKKPSATQTTDFLGCSLESAKNQGGSCLPHVSTSDQQAVMQQGSNSVNKHQALKNLLLANTESSSSEARPAADSGEVQVVPVGVSCSTGPLPKLKCSAKRKVKTEVVKLLASTSQKVPGGRPGRPRKDSIKQITFKKDVNPAKRKLVYRQKAQKTVKKIGQLHEFLPIKLEKEATVSSHTLQAALSEPLWQVLRQVTNEALTAPLEEILTQYCKEVIPEGFWSGMNDGEKHVFQVNMKSVLSKTLQGLDSAVFMKEIQDCVEALKNFEGPVTDSLDRALTTAFTEVISTVTPQLPSVSGSGLRFRRPTRDTGRQTLPTWD